MKKSISKQRIYSSLLILGAFILFYRTLSMIFFENALNLLNSWVIVLLFTESLIDILCIVFSIRWFISNDSFKDSVPLRLGAAAAIFHAFRVLIYVLGRTGPWVNFDIRPEYQSTYTFDYFWVWFAAVLSVLGIIGVIIIWLCRKMKKKSDNSG